MVQVDCLNHDPVHALAPQEVGVWQQCGAERQEALQEKDNPRL